MTNKLSYIHENIVYESVANGFAFNEALNYAYDAMGNRVRKMIYEPTSTLKSTTWYVRDPKGTAMATYTKTGSDTLRLSELPIYGSERIGMMTPNVAYKSANIDTMDATFTRTLGKRMYELKDHLGNVRATVSDILIDHTGSKDAELVASTDYYPFGMEMPGRTYKATGSAAYRYGFNGKENDNEVKGEGDQQDYGFRIYDPRLAKFLSVDPLTSAYPSWSPYPFAMNRPIDGVDVDGLEWGQKEISAGHKMVVERWVYVRVYNETNRSRFEIDLLLDLVKMKISESFSKGDERGVDYTLPIKNIILDLRPLPLDRLPESDFSNPNTPTLIVRNVVAEAKTGTTELVAKVRAFGLSRGLLGSSGAFSIVGLNEMDSEGKLQPRSNEQVARTATHELGHQLGLDDVSLEGNLMKQGGDTSSTNLTPSQQATVTKTIEGAQKVPAP